MICLNICYNCCNGHRCPQFQGNISLVFLLGHPSLWVWSRAPKNRLFTHFHENLWLRTFFQQLDKRMTLFLLEYFESFIVSVGSYFYMVRFSLTFDMENIDEFVLSRLLRKRIKCFSLQIYYFTEF